MIFFCFLRRRCIRGTKPLWTKRLDKTPRQYPPGQNQPENKTPRGFWLVGFARGFFGGGGFGRGVW